jgi:hypothetical protein
VKWSRSYKYLFNGKANQSKMEKYFSRFRWKWLKFNMEGEVSEPKLNHQRVVQRGMCYQRRWKHYRLSSFGLNLKTATKEPATSIYWPPQTMGSVRNQSCLDHISPKSQSWFHPAPNRNHARRVGHKSDKVHFTQSETTLTLNMTTLKIFPQG